MPKALAEQSNSLSISWLKKKNCLFTKQFGIGIKSGTIDWTLGENKSSIGWTIVMNKENEQDYIRLFYTFTDYRTGEKGEMDFKVPLVATSCNYGGVRYWFLCPLAKNGQPCGRRIGVLYRIGKYFGCRHCGEIAYNSQRQSEKYKGFVSIPDIERAEREVKRYYYKGKPTRKYKKVLKLNDKFEYGFMKAYARIDKDFGRKFAGLKK